MWPKIHHKEGVKEMFEDSPDKGWLPLLGELLDLREGDVLLVHPHPGPQADQAGQEGATRVWDRTIVIMESSYWSVGVCGNLWLVSSYNNKGAAVSWKILFIDMEQSTLNVKCLNGKNKGLLLVNGKNIGLWLAASYQSPRPGCWGLGPGRSDSSASSSGHLRPASSECVIYRQNGTLILASDW